MLLEFRPLSPLRRRFNPLKLNDRDHRKILLADGQMAFLGGVNMARVYENPRSANAPPDAEKAFWYDAAVRIEGSAGGGGAEAVLPQLAPPGRRPAAAGRGLPARCRTRQRDGAHRRQRPP